MKKGFSLLIVLFLSSCALAPFSHTPTASTIGAGAQSLDAGLIEGQLPFFRYGYGISGNIDIGAETEVGFGSYNLGAWTKIAPINNPSGASAALILGLGQDFSGDSKYWYLGPMVSQRFGFFEPGVALRYYDVTMDSDDINMNSSEGSITINGAHLRYWYMVLSATVWPAEWIGIYVQGGKSLNTKGGSDVTDGFIFNLGGTFKF